MPSLRSSSIRDLHRDEPRIFALRKHRRDHLLVLLRLKRTRRINNTSARPNGTQRSAKNRTLPFGLPIADPQGCSRWRISGLRPSVPVPLQGTSASTTSYTASSSRAVSIGESALNSITERRKPLPQLGQVAAGSTRRPRCALQDSAPQESASFPREQRSNRESLPPRGASSATSCDPSS